MADAVVVRARRGVVTLTATGAECGRRQQTGAVTAEAAMVLPLLVAFAMGLVWILGVAVAQVRVVDAAREAARAAARGDSAGAAVARGRRVAPAGARFSISQGGDQVRVRVTAEIHGPGGLFAHLPGVRVSSESVATEEPR
jgi:Flp pilus assembly protein TadG